MQVFCFLNAGTARFDWQVLASSRLSRNHLWSQPRNTPTKLRSKVRPRRQNGKNGSYRDNNKSYSQVSPVWIFLITLVTWLKARRAEWDSQDKCKAHRPMEQLQNANPMQDDSKYHKVIQRVHTPHYTDQQPGDVKTICNFSHWDPEKKVSCPIGWRVEPQAHLD